ncbi:MAG: O-antigen ligase family protein [Fusobacteriales bacterium]|nr:O-antigen ligase family protein [Fusobacteriales bacterium]
MGETIKYIVRKFLTGLRLFQNFILIMLPYAISKAGNHSRNTTIITLIAVTFIYIIIGKKKIKLDKKLVIFGALYILITSLNFWNIRDSYNREQMKTYTGVVIYILFAFSMTQIDIDKRLYRWIPVLISLFSLAPAFRALSEWHKNGFSTDYRIFGDSWPSVFCMELGMMILASIVVIFYEKQRIFKVLASISLIIGFTAIVGIQARIAIAMIPFFFLLTAASKNLKIGVKLGIAFLVCLLVTVSTDFEKYFKRFDSSDPGGSYSNQVRVEIYKRTKELIKENSVLGIGFYNLRGVNVKDEPRLLEYVETDTLGIKKEIPGTQENLKLWSYSATHLHNNLLETLVTQGILGLVSYVCFLFFLLVNLLKNFRNKDFIESREVFVLACIAFLYITIDGIIDTNIYMIKVNQAFYFMMGLALNKRFFLGKQEKDGE